MRKFAFMETLNMTVWQNVIKKNVTIFPLKNKINRNTHNLSKLRDYL